MRNPLGTFARRLSAFLTVPPKTLMATTWGAFGYRSPVQRNLNTFWRYYADNEVVFAGVSETVMASATVPFSTKMLQRGAYILAPQNDPIQERLENPNSRQDAVQFRERMDTELIVTGNSIIAEWPSDRGEVIGEFSVLPTRNVYVTQDKRSGLIDQYYFDPSKTHGGPNVAFLNQPPKDAIRFPPERIIHRTYAPDPWQYEWGMSPISPAVESIEADFQMTFYIREFFRKGAVPPYLFVSEVSMTTEQQRQMQKLWEQNNTGVPNAWSLGILDGTKGEIMRLGLAAGSREVGLNDLRHSTEVRILMALNVPPIVVGAALGIENMTYCLTPETRLLTSDLHWKPVGSLGVGDTVVSCDEQQTFAHGRRMRKGTITRLGRKMLPCYRVTLADGTTVTCSDKHPWLMRKRGRWQWVETEKLRCGDIALRLVTPWEKDTSKEAGWLAGLFDGEGHLSLGRGSVLTFSQKPGDIMDKTAELLRSKGFQTHGPVQQKGTSAHILRLTNRQNILRFLGSVRPQRLLAKSEGVWNGSKVMGDHVAVVSLEYVGPKETVMLETDAHTVVAEGYFQHQSNYDQARMAMWEENTEPLIHKRGAAFTTYFRRRLSRPDLLISGDFSSVMAVQKRWDERSERATRELQSGMTMRNESRTLVGLQPDANGDTFYIPLNLTPEPGSVVTTERVRSLAAALGDHPETAVILREQALASALSYGASIVPESIVAAVMPSLASRNGDESKEQYARRALSRVHVMVRHHLTVGETGQRKEANVLGNGY